MRKIWHGAVGIAGLALVLATLLMIQRRSQFLQVMEYHRNQQWAYETQVERLVPPSPYMTYTAVPNPSGTGAPDDIIMQPNASSSPFANYLGIHAPLTDPETVGKPERARAAYHERLRAKYRRAAERPWVSVEADPAPPE